MICIEATTEVEALRKALVKAEGKAVKEHATHKKLKARVNEVQQELQDVVRKCETLERDAWAKENELRPRAPSRRSRRPGRSRRVRH